MVAFMIDCGLAVVGGFRVLGDVCSVTFLVVWFLIRVAVKFGGLCLL